MCLWIIQARKIACLTRFFFLFVQTSTTSRGRSKHCSIKWPRISQDHSKQFKFAENPTIQTLMNTLGTHRSSICQAWPRIGGGINWSCGQTRVEICLHINQPPTPRGAVFTPSYLPSPGLPPLLFFSLCLSSNPSFVNGLQFKTSESCWLSRTEGVKKWSRDHRQMEVRDKREGRQRQIPWQGCGVESSKLKQALPPPPPSATNTPSIYSATHSYNHIWNGGKTGRLSGGGGMVGWCYLRDSSRCRFSQHTCHVCYSSA